MPPRLQGTYFVAFGDSITAGENGIVNLLFLDVGHEYPRVLASLLADRYKTQTPRVLNFGVPGEAARGKPGSPGGTDRIARVLDQTHPDALLLLEGVNDLVNGPEAIAGVIDALRFDIERAELANIKQVFLSTLTPVKAGSRDWAIRDGDLITPTNAAIRTLAAQERVVLVDGYQALASDPGQYLEVDGLHLTRAGRSALARAFFAAIEASFEVDPDGPRLRQIRIHER